MCNFICKKSVYHKTLFALLALMVSPFVAHGQYSVSATVSDPDGNPEEYATYRIFAIPDTLHPVVGDVTTDMGVIDASLPKAGDYRMVISAMMKLPVSVDFSVSPDSPSANLGIISTRFAGETLNEITVTAQRPLVVKEIDRIGYDVNADSEASTSNLREILRKVPLVTVDDDGTIKVNGSENFKIYRNGRPNNAFTKNSKDIFAAIPASTIKKIEVITDPGAREDAESSGVILNIVTNSTSSMNGVAGNIGLNWASNQGPNANAFIMTQIKKLTLSGSGGYYNFSNRNVCGRHTMSTKYLDTGNKSEADSDYAAGGNGGWFNVEGSFELDTLNLFTTSVNGFVGRNTQNSSSLYTMFDSFNNPLYSFRQKSYYPTNGYTDIDFSLDYQHSTHLKGETLTLSYRLSHTRQTNDQTNEYSELTNTPFDYTSMLSDFNLNFFEHTFQFDWSRPFGKRFLFDTGAKYILRTSHSVNHQSLIVPSANDITSEDEFEHRYHIFGVYADIRGTFGKFTARAGLRYEYSRLGADFIKGDGTDFHTNLNDVVPNASLAWNPSMSSMWKLSYNRNINRPGISYLNPAVTITPTSVSYGNPNLESMSTNNFLINYSLIKAKFNMDLTASFNFADNGTGRLEWTEGDINYSTYANLLHSRNFTFSAFLQWQLSDKSSFMLNGNIGYADYKIHTDTEFSRLNRWNGFFFARFQQKLPWELSLSLNANYFSGWLINPYQYMTSPASNIGYGVALKRSFLKNKTLDISLTANNIGLPDRVSKTYILNNGTEGYQEQSMKHRMGVTIGVSWRFGSLRAQVKKAGKTITNDDLTGRKNE